MTYETLGYDPEFGKGDEMFKDLALSKDLVAEYHEKQFDDKALSVMVLQYSCWPYKPKKGREIDLPPAVLPLETFQFDNLTNSFGRCSVLWSDIQTSTKQNINHANSTGFIRLGLLH